MKTALSQLLAVVFCTIALGQPTPVPTPAAPSGPVATSPPPVDVALETATQKLQVQAADSILSLNSQFIRVDVPTSMIRRIQATDRKDHQVTLSDGTVLRGDIVGKTLHFTDRGRRVEIAAGQLKDATFSTPMFARPSSKELLVRTRIGESLRTAIPTGDLTVRTKDGSISRSWSEVRGISFSSATQVTVSTLTGEELKGAIEILEFQVLLGDRKIACKPPLRVLETISTVEYREPAAQPAVPRLNGQTLMLVRVKTEAAWAEIETSRLAWTIVKTEVTQGKASLDTSASSRSVPALRITTETTPAIIDITLRLDGTVPETSPLTIKKSNRGNVRVEINPDASQRATQWVESQGGSPPEGRTFDIRP